MPKETKNEFIKRVAQEKAKGMLKGVWDLVWYWRGVLYLFDVKIGSDRLSDAQKAFRDAVIAQGGKAFEIETVEQFKKIIDMTWELRQSE